MSSLDQNHIACLFSHVSVPGTDAKPFNVWRAIANHCHFLTQGLQFLTSSALS